MGPTLEICAFFSTNQVKRLLSSLCKKSQHILAKKQQDIFVTCIPAIFDTKMTELTPIKHINQMIPVQKIIHLRESIFLVSYISGLIEMIDFEDTKNSEEPLARFQVPRYDVTEYDPGYAYMPESFM